MKIFLPVLHNGKFIVDPAHGPADLDEENLFQLIWHYPAQQRRHMQRHPLLDLAAQRKADDMAQRNYFGHVDPSGGTVNELIRSTGYRLPSHYPAKGNTCESICIGGSTMEAVLIAWYASSGHRIHVFGIEEFFREQTMVGIGNAVSQDSRKLCVFLSAPPYRE